MPETGLLQSFTFNSVTLDSDDCLQTTGVSSTLQTAKYQCSGVMKSAKGAKTFAFNYSFAVPVASDSLLTALDVGSTSTFTYYPFGNTATYIKITATRAIVTAMNIGAAANGVVTVDGTMELDDRTIGAAT